MRGSSYTKRNTKRTLVLCIIPAVLAALYLLFVDLLVDTALVPSFMRRLDKFKEITQKVVSEQIDTEDIKDNSSALRMISSAWSKDAEAENWQVTSGDGLKLTARFFPADSRIPHRYALLLHGYTGNKEAMYPIAYWYHLKGYQVLCPDFRAHGESEGDFIGMGYLDRGDVLLWIGRILDRDPDAAVVIHGLSMGASCALMLSGMEEVPACVRAVVADSAFTDAYSMFRVKIRDWFHLPAFPIIDTARLLIRLRGGYDLKAASPADAVTGSSIPTLFIYGEEDVMIPADMTPELYERAACEKELYAGEGAGHCQAYEKAPAVYFRTVQGFLDPVMPVNE